jgi:glycosyltransferase involved in cell wall biosynthesis
MFGRTLLALKEKGLKFNVSMLGKVCQDFPASLTKVKEELAENILNWGYVPSRVDYVKVLHQADVVVSTAKHEFFGVAM